MALEVGSVLKNKGIVSHILREREGCCRSKVMGMSVCMS